MDNSHELKTENLSAGYSIKVLDNVCMSVKSGKITTLIGPNGSGKSTLLKTICGHLKSKAGVSYYDGEEIDYSKRMQVATHISSVLTDRLNPELMTCREIVEMGRYPYTGYMGVMSENDRRIVDEIIEQMGIGSFEKSMFSNISDGQRQRVMIARAICQEPEILIMDEPVSYLDIKFKLDILDKLKKLVKSRGIGILMSLHELDFAMRISDMVVAVSDGGVRFIGNPQEVFTEENIRKLYGIEGVDTDLLGNEPWFKSENKAERSTRNNPKSNDFGNTCNAGITGKRAKAIMIQGTMSNVGKSFLVGGLLRVFAQDGYRVAPFKSQNMALNSFVTEEGLEMGRAQVMQAECSLRKPDVAMNPILLKPVSNMGSQVIVNGQVLGNMKAREYFEYRERLKPDIVKAYEKLSEDTDIIVIEGAGSPAEINLLKNDIVNMGLAKLLNVPVLLAGDIDRGGVFAQLIGTLDLLEDSERDRIKGLIVNKFRGDASLFADGISMLEEKGRNKVVGLVPYMDVQLEDEDSLSDRFYANARKIIDIAVIRLPHISNFTDFNVFEQLDVSVRYVVNPHEIDGTDMVIIPGTKNTIEDLRWLKSKGFKKKLLEVAGTTIIFGICGGYQMLGNMILDPSGVEFLGKEEGLGLLNVSTVMDEKKHRMAYSGKIESPDGDLSLLAGIQICGYEIHMGRTIPDSRADISADDGAAAGDKHGNSDELREFTSDNTGYCRNNVYGTYIHGIFDKKEMAAGIVRILAKKKQVDINTEKLMDYDAYKEIQYNKMADILRESLDMDYIYSLLGISK